MEEDNDFIENYFPDDVYQSKEGSLDSSYEDTDINLTWSPMFDATGI